MLSGDEFFLEAALHQKQCDVDLWVVVRLSMCLS